MLDIQSGAFQLPTEKLNILNRLTARVRASLASFGRFEQGNLFTDGSCLFILWADKKLKYLSERDWQQWHTPVMFEIPRIGIVEVGGFGKRSTADGDNIFFLLQDWKELEGYNLGLPNVEDMILKLSPTDDFFRSPIMNFRRLSRIYAPGDAAYSITNGAIVTERIDDKRIIHLDFWETGNTTIRFAGRDWFPVGWLQEATKSGGGIVEITKNRNDFYAQRPLGSFEAPRFAYAVCGKFRWLVLSVTTSGFARLKWKSNEIHVQLDRATGALPNKNDRYFEWTVQARTGWYDTETDTVVDRISI